MSHGFRKFPLCNNAAKHFPHDGLWGARMRALPFPRRFMFITRYRSPGFGPGTLFPKRARIAGVFVSLILPFARLVIGPFVG
jgi:hypothetical protein